MKFNRLLVFMVFAVIACVFAVGNVSAAGNNSTGPADSAYPTYQVNNQHTGQSNYTGPQNATIKFQNVNSQSANSYMAIGSDGTILIGDTSHTLYAYDPNGTLKWTYLTPGNISTANRMVGVTVAKDGTIIVPSELGMSALYPNGTLKWYTDIDQYHNRFPTYTAPVITDDTIYMGAVTQIGSLDSLFFAFNLEDGSPKWAHTELQRYFIFDGFMTDPAIGPDGTIYITFSGYTSSGNVTLFAFDPEAFKNVTFENETYDVLPKWSLTFEKGSFIGRGLSSWGGGIVIGPDGTIYVGVGGIDVDEYAVLYAVNPDGTIKWVLTDNGNYTSQNGTIINLVSDLKYPMSISQNGTIYAFIGNDIVTINPDDGTTTTFYTGATGIAPIIGADGTLYFHSDTYIYAVNSNGTLKWSLAFSFYQYPIMIDSKGTLYLSTRNKGLVAIQDLLADYTDSHNDLEISFTDRSTNLPTTWFWDFGDGTNSTLQNPTHVYSQAGNYTVTLTVKIASGLNNTIPKLITVNSAPVLETIGNKIVDEEKALIFTLNATDADGNPLTYSVIGSLPDGASFDPVTRLFTWIPTFNQAGIYTVTFSVTDGLNPVNETITITVENVNRAPVFALSNVAINENQLLNLNFNDKDSDGDTLTYNVTGLPSGATFDPTTRVLNWTPNFNQAGTYKVTFNVTDGNTDTLLDIFITVNDVDNKAPTVQAVDPVKATVIKSNKKAINVTFNEAIKAGNLYIELKNSSNILANIATTIKGNTLIITPTTALFDGKYTLTVHKGAITDLTGNKLANDYTSSFSVDSVAPTVFKMDPAKNAVKVSAGKTIKVTFSEVIKVGSKFWVELKDSSKKAVAFKYSISGKTLTIDPVKNLVESRYTLVLHTGSVTDLAGNALKLKSAAFSVGTAPKISKIDPKSGATGVARSKTIKVTFNEAIKAGTYKIELKTTSGKKVSIKKSNSGKVLTITHAKLAANTKYKLVIYSGSITDKAGNPVAAKTYTFKTGAT